MPHNNPIPYFIGGYIMGTKFHIHSSKQGPMLSFRTPLAFPILILVCLMPSCPYAWSSSDTEILLKKMETAYDEVNDYQANVEVRAYRRDGSFETEKFLYTFQKPKWIRLDFESPYSGMILVYPDKNGKVVLRRFFTFHLAPDNPLLRVASGQRIDQTDLGLLVRNISHSLTDHRRGPVEVTEDDRDIRIRVLADDHFREGVLTLYQFLIDKKLWLPVRVEESTPDALLERMVIFRNLRTNIGVPDRFFQLDEG
jgi:outer membrane lipoprotein-sorting protein